MWKYFLKRMIAVIPVVLGVSILVFLMVHLVPGDPVKIMFRMSGEDAPIPPEQYEAIQRKYGFDKPLPVQYLNYMSRFARGDMGVSTIRNIPVWELIRREAPHTIQLALVSLAFACVVGIPLGIVSALNRGGWLDTLTMMGATCGVSMPRFWFGLIAMLIFSVWLGILPAFGEGTLAHLVLPAVSLGIATAATIARLTRSSVLEALDEDYVRTARAKGLREIIVVGKHALRNSLIPVVTVVGLQFGHMLAGAVVVETVFSRRGIGSLTMQAVMSKDFPLAQGLVMIIAFGYVLINVLVDLLYALLDPRVSYQ
jgi:peptide/nickel transport system permease protein